MRKVPRYPLWLGHVGDARDLRGVLSAGIRALVDLAANEPPATITRDLVYCRFPLLDGAGNPPWLVQAAVACVVQLMEAAIPTLLFCSGGMSRTPVIAAAAVAWQRGCSLADALGMVTSDGPLDISPALLVEVQALAHADAPGPSGRSG